MWSSLPSNLRTVLGTALLLGLGVAAAAFTLSFFALRDAAANPDLAWGQGHAWLFPIGVDMALVFFEVLLLGASMVRITDHDRVVQYPRAIPFLLMLVAAAGTLYFNATHVPTPVRPLALAVPVASILVTLGLAYLLKMLAAASGAAAIHLAPPDQGPNRIVRHRDVLQGELVRDPQAPGAPELFPPHPVYGQVPSWAPSQPGQNGQPAVAGDQAPPGRGLPGGAWPRPARTPDHARPPGRRPRAHRHPQPPRAAGLRALCAADPGRLDRHHPPASQRATPPPALSRRAGEWPASAMPHRLRPSGGVHGDLRRVPRRPRADRDRPDRLAARLVCHL